MKPVQPSPNNGGQPVTLPKTNQSNPIANTLPPKKEPAWGGYGTQPKGSNKGDVRG